MTCCTPLSAWGWGRVKNFRKVFAGGGGRGSEIFIFWGVGGVILLVGGLIFLGGGRVGVVA